MAHQLDEHLRVIESARGHLPLLEKIARRIIACFESGGRVLICGNGGSAADAQHIAAELLGRFKRDRRPLPAIALTTDSSIVTAVSNDLGYEQVFARQVDALLTDRDVLWALSVSGTSANVVRALEVARAKQAFTIGFTGRSGSMMNELCDLCFRAEHGASDRVQETHQFAYHLICDQIEQHFAEKSKS